MPTASRCAFNVFYIHGIKITEGSNLFFGWCGCLHTDLRKQFLDIARKNSPEPRTVYSFVTTAIVRTLPIFIFFYFYLFILCVIIQDTRAMTATLAAIRTSILSDNLQAAHLLH